MDMIAHSRRSLLEAIDTPAQLRRLPEARLPVLAHELREFLIKSVSHSGGHLAAGLGVVELTVALHYVLDTPHDRLLWDVGHQAYPHKILSGRRGRMACIRRSGGLSGFPRRSESPYDAFGVAHAGTTISAALGMATAQALRGERRRVVSVIGDGALTSGMAFEALDHAGELGLDLLVILNDNNMSISPNVGALHAYLNRLRRAPYGYRAAANGRHNPVSPPKGQDRAQRATAHPPGALFEALGFEYFGPVDGHDLGLLVALLRALHRSKGPRLLHVVTRKGRGYAPAEADPVAYHSVAPFDPRLGVQAKAPATSPSYTQVFGQWLCDMAPRDTRLTAITPAMREGSGLVEFARRFPRRYFDAGIAEQHAVTLAAGQACAGMKPVVAIYSTFLQRAYDQLIHDVALQGLPILFAIDRAGLVGPDGPTHAGSFDLSYLRCIPNLIVMTPGDENECRRMLYTGFLQEGPAAVRYPRGRGPGMAVDAIMRPLPIGVSQLRRRGTRVAILAFGAMVPVAEAVGETLQATVVNMRFVKPLDEARVGELAATHELIVTLEDNVVAGGAGSAVNECLAARQLLVPVLNLGLPDRFIDQGSRAELLGECGLDEGCVRASIRARLRGSCALPPAAAQRPPPASNRAMAH